jgi:uncharacterized membrane protein YedE/YeeE
LEQLETSAETVRKPPKWVAGFKADFRSIFAEEWSPYLGIMLILFVIIALMANGLFWGIFGGLKLWGDWFNSAIGLGSVLGISSENLKSPLMHRISLMDITLVIGAFTAALISRQFLINRPPKLEFLTGAAGGALMGIGASLAGGCTTGGFFTPLLHSSPAGWAMWVGLIIGAFIGVKAMFWMLENITWGTAAPKPIKIPAGVQAAYPWLGLIIVAAILYWAAQWYYSSDTTIASRAIIVVAGFAIGFIMHRSRLCFARSFREPFVTGEGSMTKAVILGILLGTPIAALMFKAEVLDPFIAIPPVFWLGSLTGGLIFGFGMIFAGGCASGSLWRMGEGHLKLWVAAFFFAWIGSIASAILKMTGLTVREDNFDDLENIVEQTSLGIQVHLPQTLQAYGGWGAALGLTALVLIIWYALLRYNESTGKFTVD